MPYTVYRANWTQTHPMSDHEVATTGRTYRYGASDDALVRFGSGQSLTEFEFSWQPNGVPHQQAAVALNTDGSSADATVVVAVRNTGAVTGDEVVQAYFRPVNATVSPAVPLPRKQLFNFTRLRDIKPGSTAHTGFAINARSLLLANADGDLVSAPGTYELLFENGAGESLTLPLQLRGAQKTFEPFPKV